MRVLSGRLRKPDMLEKPMPGKRYVRLSALSDIFCRVGGKVFSPRGALEVPILLPAHPDDKSAPGFTRGITMDTEQLRRHLAVVRFQFAELLDTLDAPHH
jgi:hypothetical protein